MMTWQCSQRYDYEPMVVGVLSLVVDVTLYTIRKDTCVYR